MLSPALAQQVPETQSTVADPGRISEQMREEAVSPEVMPEIEVKELRLKEAPPGAEKVKFVLEKLYIEGVTAYEKEELGDVYSAELGKKISLADLYDIAARLTNKYRNEGYILTQIVVPPQTIESGKARLKVVEGFVDKVTIQGDGGKANSLIRQYAGNVRTGGRALNARELERTMLLINDLPGVKARGVLAPSATKVGAADLNIFIERDPIDAMLAIDNYGSRYLGPLQLTAAGSVNNYFDRNERITAQAAIAPDPDIGDEMTYFSMSYEQPLWNQGTMFQAFASFTATEPGYDLDQFNVKGNSQFFSLRMDHPFVKTRNLKFNARAIFDWRDAESRNDLEPTREDRIRALRFGGTLEILDTLLGVGLNSLDLEISRGLEFFGAETNNRATLSRPLADINFLKMGVEIQRLQRLANNINLLIGTRGQWSKDALLSSEEFGVGGINYGRAFDPSEIIGDEGIAGKLELQWNKPVEWSLVQDYQLFGFFDAGRIWNDDATSNNTERDTITSAGFGLRTEFMEETEADLTVAFPLNRDVQTQQDKDPRVYFGLSRKF
jgi:hemolysin activation/secretion protein